MNSSNFFQHRFQPGAARDANRALWENYRRLQESQWSADSVLSLQLGRLQLLIRHCEQHVPWYQQQFAHAGVRADDLRTLDDLRRFPMLDRMTYVENAPTLVAESLPPGTQRAGTLSTSGTTGIPVIIQNTNVVAEQWLAFAMRDLEWCGLDPRNRLASIRPSGKSGLQLQTLLTGVDLPKWGKQLAEVVETGVSHFMDMAAEAQTQLDWLVDVDPDYLLSFPSNIEYLARLFNDVQQTLPNLKAIQTIGEMLDADIRATIESAFGVPVFDTYSCCEVGYVASPCPDGHGYHVHSENVIVEVLNENDQSCVTGETGRIVLTTLHNFATPFIRYDIHDEATVGAARCPCGRGLPLLTAIHGRQRPMFQLPDGSALSSSPIAQHIRKVGGFHQFQLEQTAVDRAVLRIVPDASWNEHLQNEMTSNLQSGFGDDMTIDIEVVDRIARSRGGKLQSTLVSIPNDNSSNTRREPGPHRPADMPEVFTTSAASEASVAEHKRQVVYACSKTQWLQETLRSAQSFAELMPVAKRILFATPNITSALPQLDVFTSNATVDKLRHEHRPRFEAMMNCNADQAIFIDGDTLLIQPADELWELLNHFDIALAEAPQYFHSQALKLGIYDKLPAVAEAQPEWNSGVIVARITKRFRDFVQRWSELFAICREHGYEMDQAALRVALAISDLRIATLPARYNFRANMPQTIKGSVKLLHAHGDLPAIAARVNASLDLRLYSPQAADFRHSLLSANPE